MLPTALLNIHVFKLDHLDPVGVSVALTVTTFGVIVIILVTVY